MFLLDFKSMDVIKLRHKRDYHWDMAELARMDQDHQDELWHVTRAKAYQRAIEERLGNENPQL